MPGPAATLIRHAALARTGRVQAMQIFLHLDDVSQRVLTDAMRPLPRTQRATFTRLTRAKSITDAGQNATKIRLGFAFFILL